MMPTGWAMGLENIVKAVSAGNLLGARRFTRYVYSAPHQSQSLSVLLHFVVQTSLILA